MLRLAILGLILLVGSVWAQSMPSGWRIRWVEAPIPVGPTVMCGERTCHSIGTYRRNSVLDPERRTLWIVKGAPPVILWWELCNLERYEQTGILADQGCAP